MIWIGVRGRMCRLRASVILRILSRVSRASRVCPVADPRRCVCEVC